MPVVDLTEVDEAENFAPLPSGDYPARIIEVDESHTKSGDAMWKVKFAIFNHELAGRHFYDNWVFSENPNAKQRLKLITKRLGFDVEKPFNLTPDSVINKVALITLLETTYMDSDGNERPSNNVHFSGYDYYDSGTTDSGAGETNKDDDLPF